MTSIWFPNNKYPPNTKNYLPCFVLGGGERGGGFSIRRKGLYIYISNGFPSSGGLTRKTGKKKHHLQQIQEKWNQPVTTVSAFPCLYRKGCASKGASAPLPRIAWRGSDTAAAEAPEAMAGGCHRVGIDTKDQQGQRQHG